MGSTQSANKVEGYTDTRKRLGNAGVHEMMGSMSKKSILDEIARANNQRSPGIKHLRRHLNGERLTRREAMYAKCCDCMAYYEDGARDCENPDCPMYDYMPYRKGVAVADEAANV